MNKTIFVWDETENEWVNVPNPDEVFQYYLDIDARTATLSCEFKEDGIYIRETACEIK